MFYLTTHSTHFIYGYMSSDIWLRTILIVRKETCCCHIGNSLWLTARVILYAPSHRQDSTYHSPWYTSRGALAGTRTTCTKIETNKVVKECYVITQNLKQVRLLAFQTRLKVRNECYLIRQDNTIYKFYIKIYFLSIGQDKSKLQKQIGKLLILIATAAW